MNLSDWYTLFVILQLFHSQEEIHTGFYEKSPIFAMPKKVFIAFETVFLLFNASFIIFKQLPLRDYWMGLFLLLMFANGVEHFLWVLERKRYVPGLITGVLVLLSFFAFYFSYIIT